MAEADADRTGRGLVIGPHVLRGLAERRQHGAAMLVEAPAGSGQRDAARPSFEQLDAEIGFEGGEMAAERRRATLSVSAARDSTPAL